MPFTGISCHVSEFCGCPLREQMPRRAVLCVCTASLFSLFWFSPRLPCVPMCSGSPPGCGCLRMRWCLECVPLHTKCVVALHCVRTRPEAIGLVCTIENTDTDTQTRVVAVAHRSARLSLQRSSYHTQRLAISFSSRAFSFTYSPTVLSVFVARFQFSPGQKRFFFLSHSRAAPCSVIHGCSILTKRRHPLLAPLSCRLHRWAGWYATASTTTMVVGQSVSGLLDARSVLPSFWGQSVTHPLTH